MPKQNQEIPRKIQLRTLKKTQETKETQRNSFGSVSISQETGSSSGSEARNPSPPGGGSRGVGWVYGFSGLGLVGWVGLGWLGFVIGLDS